MTISADALVAIGFGIVGFCVLILVVTFFVVRDAAKRSWRK